MSMRKSIIAVVFGCAIYAIVGVLLYRARVLSGASLFDSDVLVFVVPAVLSFSAVYLLAGMAQALSARKLARVAIAAATILLTFLSYFSIAANLYGT